MFEMKLYTSMDALAISQIVSGNCPSGSTKLTGLAAAKEYGDQLRYLWASGSGVVQEQVRGS